MENKFKKSKTHVRIHGIDGYLMSVNLECEPGDIISLLLDVKKSEMSGGMIDED